MQDKPRENADLIFENDRRSGAGWSNDAALPLDAQI